MTAVRATAIESPDWRAIFPVPPDARLYTMGPYCPIDDTVLQEQVDGFRCSSCSAAWDFFGLHGRWPAAAPRTAVSLPVVAAGLAGYAMAAAGMVAILARLGEGVVWLLAAVIGVAAAYLLVAAWLSGLIEEHRCRRNRMHIPDGEVAR
ncbi:hypothetical protein [Couchioplanes caeruleus]|uniref:Uncharacterized protein n=2 Tax=Couchioplanes caeruleus TaxID=56438 RepID=A0A1K0GB55_9ACTN|nr:hypothetical protein [Couchioplanes caeruleus]OJF14482.1 hypothetical protein BG844_09595 [Couchioplanes caeruleus subsp. caeruleus]ROP21266.1 hypothetical protein EDD30_7662 [Couchioplanes caeruleus]